VASTKNVPYAIRGDVELSLDVYPPSERYLGEPRRAAILYFHGGGWRAGSREMMRPDARAMAEHGYVGVPVQYRLVGQAPFPAQVEDVKAAVRWVRTHAAELGVDPERIVLWGSSAGAHLALLAAGTPGHAAFEGGSGPEDLSSEVAAVIAVHPPTELCVGQSGGRHTTSAVVLLGADATEAQAREASPITYASSAFPPTLLLHGTYDKMVNHAASEAMLGALRRAKVPVDLHLFHGHTHGFAALPSVRRRIAAEVDYFLDRTVLDPAKYRAEAEEFSLFARREAAARMSQSAPVADASRVGGVRRSV